MKINKKSWHYRLIETFDGKRALKNNLCGYFWQVIISIFLLIAFIFIWTILLAFLCFTLLAPFMDLDIYGAISTSVGWVIIGFIVRAITIDLLYDTVLTKPIFSLSESKEAKVNIFIEFIRAKKEKVCPSLEFSD